MDQTQGDHKENQDIGDTAPPHLLPQVSGTTTDSGRGQQAGTRAQSREEAELPGTPGHSISPPDCACTTAILGGSF